jgi:predicted alpha/beta-hydrolase family hydrolase
MPAQATALYVLAHGAGAGMKHRFMETIAEALAGANIATLRWEFPYMAAGKARPDSPAVAEAAVRSVWLAAREQFAGLPMFAGGKSFGGRMTSRAHAAEALPDLQGIAFLGFPLHPPEKPGIERAEHLAQAKGKLLFLSGDRDDLAGLELLRPVVAKLGKRAKLHVVEHADHGFEVLKRTGRTDQDVMAELVRELKKFFQRRRQERSDGTPLPTPRK